MPLFTEKSKIPSEQDLIAALGDKYKLWQEISDLVILKYPKAVAEWNFPGVKYGWSFRIKDKKRAILYLLPGENTFRVAFVFGKKAFEKILESNVSNEIKTELENARVYAEGRGIRLSVENRDGLADISQLIDFKIGS